MATSFTPISPAPARDYFVFDFTAKIGASGQIASVAWNCSVSDISAVPDDSPTSRIVAMPTFTDTQTSALCGDMVDGVIYQLQAVATIDDGRVLINEGDLLCSSIPSALRPPLVVDGVVQFDYAEWVAKFPEFAQLDPDQAQEYWNEASQLFRNDLTSPEQDPIIRREILDLLTAHCAALFALPPIGRGGASAVSGVVTNRSVNGVSVGYSGLLPGFNGTRAWFATTQYGLKFLTMTAAYRLFHYVQGPQRYPYPPNRNWPPAYGGYYYPWTPWQF